MKAKSGRIRRHFAAVAAVLVLLGLGGSAWAQSAVAGFPEGLDAELRRLGWDPQEIRQLAQEPADWGGLASRHARLTAEALHYARSEDAEIGPREQVQLALAACSMIREMESLGYDEGVTARAVFAGVRASLGELAAWRSGQGGDDLGERLRSRMRQELHVLAARQVKTQAQERARAERRDDVEGPKIGPGPGQPPGGN
ncbi:MAG: hypothetical protein JW820_12725 [Spirochaetales bacterium]|nr:hypothetical protein [Spirochaetales bacterium]